MLFASAMPTHAEKNRGRRAARIISFKTSQYRRFLPVLPCMIAQLVGDESLGHWQLATLGLGTPRSQCSQLPVALPGAGVSTRWHLLLGDGGSTHSASQTTTPSFSLPSSYARRVQRIITFFLRPAASAFLPHARPLGLVVDPLPTALLGRTNLTTTLSAPSVLATPLPTPRAPFQLQRTCLGWGSIKHG
jgi:hypothetical protein